MMKNDEKVQEIQENWDKLQIKTAEGYAKILLPKNAQKTKWKCVLNND